MDLVVGLRRRVLELLDGINPPSRYKVVVVDKRAKEMLDLVVDKSELLNRQIANVLLIDEHRPPEPYLDAVYILEQTSYNFGCIDADFAFTPPRYAGAHVFLLPRWRSSNTERQRFEQRHSPPANDSKMVLRQIGDAPLAFFALEKRLFSFKTPHANLVLYNETFHSDVMDFVDITGRQIAAVCESLRVAPYIRYTHRFNLVRANGWPTLLARSALKHIEDRKQLYYGSHMDQNRATLLILDRTVDLGAPLRHEALFQALSMDITNGDGAPPAAASEPPAALNGKTLGIKFEEFAGGYPSEKDKLWTLLRHKHIVAATQELTTRLKEFRAANPHFEENAKNVSVGDVRNMLAALPEFMRERESLGLNLDLAQECMTAIEQPFMQSLLDLEQTLVLGTNEHGEPVPQSRIADTLIAVLAQSGPQTNSTTKIRILILYALARNGIRLTDLVRLQKHSRLRDGDMDTIKAMEYLGAPIVADPAAAQPNVPFPLTCELPHQPLKFHRVKPGVQVVVEKLLSNELAENEYPYMGDVPDIQQEVLSTATSLRNRRQKATWAQNVATNEHVSSGMAGNTGKGQAVGPAKTLILFIIGGVTASEAAAVYEMAHNTGISIVIGSHDFLTPNKYVEFLGNINTPREQLQIPEDQPQPTVPEFLSQPPPERSQSVPVNQVPQRQVQRAKSVSPGVSVPKAQPIQRTNTQAMSKPVAKPLAKSHTQPLSTTTQVPGTSYNGTVGGVHYLGNPPPPAKEKKDMKDKIKGAFRIKR